MHIGITGPACLRSLSEEYCMPDAPTTHSFAPLTYYITELLRRGHRIHLFTTGESPREWVRRRGNLTVTVVPRRKQGTMRNFLADERAALTKAIERSECDIIHANWTYEYALATQAAHKPYLVTAHDAPFALLPYMRPFNYWFLHALMAIPVLLRADRLVVISPYLQSYYQRYHLYSKPIHVIPEYVPDQSFTYYRNKECCGPTFSAAMNGWGKRKNAAALITAFSYVRRDIPDARLLLFGNGHGRMEQADVWAKQHGLEDGIEFAGDTPNSLLLARWQDEVDILVHPALEESFCVAIADAMAMGIPVIAGKSSGAVPWLLGEGECGMLVDVKKPHEIAQAMLHLARDGVAREMFRSRARSRAVASFRIDAVADQYLRLYSDLL